MSDSKGDTPLRMLTFEEVLEILRTTPEQCVFDWKTNLAVDKSDDNKKSELVKDVTAIGNATTLSPGFIFYGVNPQQSDPVVGLSASYDDAQFQQLLKGKVDPPVQFIYYEVSCGSKRVGVMHIPASRQKPHVITVDFGVLRDGQIPIRRGSATGGIRRSDLFECFYGDASPYFTQVLKQVGANAADMQARALMLRELREHENQLTKEMEIVGGLPPGSLGAKW